MQGGANDYLLPFYRGAEVIAGQLLRTAERILEKLPGTRICIESLYPMYTKKTGNGIPFWSEGKSNKEIQAVNSEIERLCGGKRNTICGCLPGINRGGWRTAAFLYGRWCSSQQRGI